MRILKLYRISIYTILIIAITTLDLPSLSAQGKWDYQWVIGYDTSTLDLIGNAILIDFNIAPPNISGINTITNFWMEGSNSSFSDNEGALKFYSNGCEIIGSDNSILENGDNINPGLVEEVWCPHGGSPIPQGLISLPVPGNDNLAFVFNLDLGEPYIQNDSFISIAPEKLFYNLIDISKNDGIGSVIKKNVLLLQDTFARGTLQAVRHQNGVDWWLIVPKSHSNCYFLFLISNDTIQTPMLKCAGKVWNDSDGGQSAFSPDGTLYSRFNYQNGLNILNFSSTTGDIEERSHIDFPGDTFPSTAGVAISSNSQFIYVTAGNKLYQFDLTVLDIESTKTLVGQSELTDGKFNMAALAPNNKIYISGTGSRKYLHVINYPDCPGIKSKVVVKGLSLPSFNYISIPNFPHYRNNSQEVNCDTIVSSYEIKSKRDTYKFYPNPIKNYFTIETKDSSYDFQLEVYDLLGRLMFSKKLYVENLINIDLSFLSSGSYLINCRSENKIESKIIIKI